MVPSVLSISEFAIDPGDFLTQTASAVLAGLVVLFVQPQWMGKGVTSAGGHGAAPATSVRRSGSGTHNVYGAQAVVGKKARVRAFHQSVTSSSSTTNVYGSNAAAESTEDVLGKVVAVGLVVLMGVVLFVSYWPLVVAIVVGTSAALGVMSGVAWRAQRRSQPVWSSGATWTLISAGLAIAASVAALTLALSTLVGARSIPDLRRQAVEAVALENGHATVLATIAEMWRQLFSMGVGGLVGVTLVALGVGVSLLSMSFAWWSTLEWLSHLRVAAGAKGAMTRARGQRFESSTGPRILVPVVAGATFAILLTAGAGSALFSFAGHR